MIDQCLVVEEVCMCVEQVGIVFFDEIDKVCGCEGVQGLDVLCEGVQCDLLLIVEGMIVLIKYGMVKIDYIFFIGVGVFYLSKFLDMILEFQGCFFICVEFDVLIEFDLVCILIELWSLLICQYIDLMSIEGVCLIFEQDVIEELVWFVVQVNFYQENIGVCCFVMLMECLFDEVFFEVLVMDGVEVKIDSGYVMWVFDGIVQD